mgnify:CR=1 FL=1
MGGNTSYFPHISSYSFIFLTYFSIFFLIFSTYCLIFPTLFFTFATYLFSLVPSYFSHSDFPSSFARSCGKFSWQPIAFVRGGRLP